MDKITYHIYAYDFRDGIKEGFYRKIEMPYKKDYDFLYLNPELGVIIENFAKIYFPEYYSINSESKPICWDWARDISLFTLELTDDREDYSEDPIGILIINDKDIDTNIDYYMEDLEYRSFIEKCLKNR